jgi:hypothetical protein
MTEEWPILLWAQLTRREFQVCCKLAQGRRIMCRTSRRFVKLRAIIPFLLALPLSAQNWGTLSVDTLVSMNTSTPGTTLTTTIGNAGTICGGNCTVGTNVNWGQQPTSGSGNPSNFKVQANQGNCSNLGPVQLTGGGTLYGTQSLNYNSLAHDDSANNTNGSLNYSASPATSATIASAMTCVTLGPPSQNNGSDWDIFMLFSSAGHYAVAQLNPSCPSSGEYGIRIEVDPTAHSACIPIAPQGTYYISLAKNFSTGLAAMWVYTSTGTLVGTTTVTGTNTGGTFDFVSIGNNEAGNNSGTFTYYQNLMVNYTSASTSTPLFWSNSALSAGVIAPGRVVNWTGAGVPGGIPTTRTQCTNTQCATVTSAGASATSTQINSAIANAPANTYVLLPAGTYSSATGCILMSVSNVTLRGAGADQTFLAPTSTSGCVGGVGQGGGIAMLSTGNTSGSPQNGPVAVSGVPVQGAKTLTLASVPNLKVGNPIILDQIDPAADNGGIFVSGTAASYTPSGTSPGLNGPYSLDGGVNAIRNGSCSSASYTNCYHQQQVVQVTQCDGNTTIGHSCSSGANITISPGLHMPNWTSVFAWWATSPIQSDGVEDLSIDATGNSGANGIEIENCQGCWVKGVRSIDTNEAQVQLLWSNLTTIRNNYFFLTQNSVSVSYGIECLSCSDTLTENNIFQAVTTPFIDNGPSSGNVWGYNFTINEFYEGAANYSIPAHGEHSGGGDTNLDEGNISNGFTGDNIHGTGNTMTFMRNFYPVQPACWISGSTYAGASYGPCTNGTTTAQTYSFHRFYNLIGNILGTSGYNTTYCNGHTDCTGGFTNSATNVLLVGIGNTVANDPNVVSTTMLWGNADPVTGYGSPRFNCAETPQFPASGTLTTSMYGVQFPYLGPCPSTNTLPASFYYSSQPSWWPSTKPWPIIGPDVTGGNLLICSGGTQSGAVVENSSQCPGGTTTTAVNGEAYSNPAMDCYLGAMSGPANGVTTSALSFNESCYNASVVTAPGTPVLLISSP